MFKFTKFLGLSIMILICNSVLVAQTAPFWGGSTDPNSTFNAGPNAWTIVGARATPQDSAKNALWEFCPAGTFVATRKGSFQGAGGIINSPSKANGAMGFNSDFLDNAGKGAASIGFGSAPAPHTGELISPIIDCSGRSTVELRFYQAIRQFVAEQRIDVSNDGGATWTKYVINTDIVTNSAHINDQRFVDITKTAANSANVKIKFVYDCKDADPRGYYYWIVDDVQLWELTPNNLAIKNANFPPANYNTPAIMMASDTFQFIADIQNNGGKTQKNVVLKAQVLKGASTVVYTDSLVIGDVPVGLTSIDGSFLEGSAVKDSSFAIDKLWAPGAALKFDTSLYRVVYTVYSQDNVDDRPIDNTFSLPFRVSNFTFSKDDGRNFGGLRPGGTPTKYNVGGLYTSGKFTGKAYFKNVYFQCTRNAADGPLGATQATVYVGEVNSSVDAGFDNFDDTQEIDLTGDPSAQLKFAGLAEVVFKDQQSDTAVVQPLDLDSKRVEFKENTRYFVFVKYDGEENAKTFHSFSTSFKNYNLGHTLVYTTNWFFGGFGSNRQASIRTDLEIETSNDDIALADNVMKLFPTPADKEITAEVNFDGPTEATLLIADYSGKILSVKDYDGLLNDRIQINTSEYASGTYFVRIGTKDGTKTMRFVVQH